jgi:hypothetical protein
VGRTRVESTMTWAAVMSLGVGGFKDSGDEDSCLENDGRSITGVPTLGSGPYPSEGKAWIGGPYWP